MARQPFIGINGVNALMPLAVGVAQSNSLFFFNRCKYENHSHCPNDKKPGRYRLRIPYVNVKIAVQILQFTDRSM
jgi:hypothetical protein